MEAGHPLEWIVETGDGDVLLTETAEDEDEHVVRGSSNLVYSSIVGMLIAVCWAYLLQQQVDPSEKCPERGCWGLVTLLGLNALAGIWYIPALTLAMMRRLSPRGIEGDRPSFRLELQAKLQQMMTDASSTCWSVGFSSFVFYLVKQLEFSASGGDPNNFVRPVAHAGDTAARRHLVHHRLAILLACLGVCAAVVLVSFATTVLATRKLASETRPIFVEIWLLLRTGLHYSCAYAIATFVGLALFSPFDLEWGGTPLRFCAALLRAICLTAISFRIAKSSFLPAEKESTGHAFLRQVLVIVAAISCHDVVVFFVVEVFKETSHWHQISFFFAYSLLLLGTALLRRNKQHSRDEDVDIFERWIVCFAWWVTYKHVLVDIWDLVGVRGRPHHLSDLHAAIYALRRIERFLWQLAVAVFSTLAFATLAALPSFVKAAYDYYLKSGENTLTSTQANENPLLPQQEDDALPQCGDGLATVDVELPLRGDRLI